MPRQAQEVNKAAETDEQVPGGEVPQAQPAKRRGRPPKNAEPADQENEERNEKEEQEAPQKRRRGRPPKPKSALQADLARAIKEERYEDAAIIRDKIKAKSQETQDELTEEEGQQESPPTKRRGRPPKHKSGSVSSKDDDAEERTTITDDDVVASLLASNKKGPAPVVKVENAGAGQASRMQAKFNKVLDEDDDDMQEASKMQVKFKKELDESDDDAALVGNAENSNSSGKGSSAHRAEASQESSNTLNAHSIGHWEKDENGKRKWVTTVDRPVTQVEKAGGKDDDQTRGKGKALEALEPASLNRARRAPVAESEEEDEDDAEEEDDDEEEDGHKDYCEISGKGGELVMCDFCECCYLPECLGVKTAEELPDPYKCPKCCGKLDKFKAEWKKKRKLAKMGQKSAKDEGSDEEDGTVAHKRSRLRPQQDSDDEMQDAEDESEGESSSESKKGGDKKSYGAHRRGGHQRVTRGMAATFGIEVETKGGRSRLKGSYSELSDNTVSDDTVSDDSSENDEDNEKVESPSKGPQRKKIRKIKNLTKVMLQATEEGKERDEWRQVAKEKAAAEVGAALVLKAPAENGEEERDVVVPEHMSAQLQPHQRVGIQFVWECCVRESRGAILAHCMGLGKTFQMITVLQCVWQQSLALGEKWKLLVLAPVNVIRNWEGEYQKFMPDSDCPPLFTMVEAGSLHEDRVNYLKDWQKEGGIMLMGYEQFRNIAAGKNIRTKGKKFAKNIGIKERYQKALLDPGPYMVVCDEGHILRRETSEVTRMVGQIKTQRRIVLSGTPLQNNLMEYHCMVDFVRPGLLGTAAAFKRDFVSPILNGQCMDSTAADVKAMRSRSFILNHLLKGVVDRADFKVLQPYLRPKHEFIIGMRLSALQVELYRSILREEVPQLSAGANGDMLNKGEKIQNIKVLGTYHKLAKVWSHPRIVVMQKHGANGYDSMDDFLDDEDEYVSSDEEDRRRKPRKKKKGKKSDEDDGEESEDEHVAGDWLKKYKEQLENLEADSMGKMLFLSKLLKEASVVGDKVLVFSQSLLLLDLIEDMLALAKQKGNGVMNSKGVARHWQLGMDYFRLDGGISGDKRRDDIAKFNKSSKARLYLISTKAGSLGVNMASANRVVLMDASWNPSYDQQAIFRAYRFGQEKECFIYRLLAHGTMEQKIYGRQVTKQALSSRVVDSEETGRHFSSEELNTLFEFTPGPTAEQVAAELAATCSLTSGNKEEAKVYNLVVLEDEGTGDAPAGDAVSEVTQGMQAPSSAAPQVPAEPAAAVSESKAGQKEQKSQGNSNLFAATRAPPKDAVLARVLGELMPEWIVGYHEADSLNEVEKELTEEEILEAWDEYKKKDSKEQPSLIVAGPDGQQVKVVIASVQGQKLLFQHQIGLLRLWRPYTHDTGRVYYYNKQTKQTQWDPPPLWPGDTAAGGYGIPAAQIPQFLLQIQQQEAAQAAQAAYLQSQYQQQMLQQQFMQQQAQQLGNGSVGGPAASLPAPLPAPLPLFAGDQQQQMLANAKLSAPA